jgi:hypothetical protein
MEQSDSLDQRRQGRRVTILCGGKTKRKKVKMPLQKGADCLIICSLTAFISVVGTVSLRIVGQDGGLVASDQEEGRHVGR